MQNQIRSVGLIFCLLFLLSLFTSTSVYAAEPVLTSPVAGTTFGGSTQTFSWSAEDNAIAYWKLFVGSAKGKSDYFKSPRLQGTETGITVTGLPEDAHKAFVRLRYKLAGTWKKLDYVFYLAGENHPPVISGIPETAATVGADYVFQATASDVDGEKLRFSIQRKPKKWSSFQRGKGKLFGTPDQTGTFSDIIISVTDERGATASLPAFSITVAESQQALEDALQTGDGSQLTMAELHDAAITRAQTELEQCKTTLNDIYPDGLQQTTFQTRSAYMESTSSRNQPLHVAANNGDARVYSWVGSKADQTRYAVLGTNVFSSNTAFGTAQTDLRDNTLNVLRWLLQRDSATDILDEPLTLLVPGYWDRQALNDWFSANSLSHQWTISSDNALLSSGEFDLYLGDIGRSLTEMQQSMSAGKPVLVFNHWYQPKDETLAEFGLTWRWYGSKSIGDMASVDTQCAEVGDAGTLLTTLTHLRDGMPDFAYESIDCPSRIGTVQCNQVQVTDAAGNSIQSLFNQGASQVRGKLQALDASGTDVFSLDEGSRLLKLAVLLADKYRADIQFPMDKVNSDDTAFFRALFADYAVHYAREHNTYQPDMGLFTDAQAALNAAATQTASRTYTPTQFGEWTSTGLYAPPGKTITVRRTDNGDADVRLRMNFVRESTRIWNNNGYNRPRYLSSQIVTLEKGRTYTLSTPYGGPVYLGWFGTDSATPFSVDMTGVLENPLLEEFDEIAIQSFLNDVLVTDSDWIDIKTPYAEIHTLKANMLEAFAEQDGNAANSYTTQDVQDYISDLNTYLIAGNYGYAGFAGEGLPPLSAEVNTFCSGSGLDNVDYDGSVKNLCTDATIHAKPAVQHINSDIQALCGGLCAGNPFDSGYPVMPLGWGENHEMGHNLQRTRLKIYNGRSGEVSNNIFPLYTQWRWTVDQGLNRHPSQTRPDHQDAFQILQSAIQAGTAADISHPLWSGSGTYDNAFERLSFYIQLAYTQQSWDMYTKLYLMERMLSDAVKDSSGAKWEAVKYQLGMGTYTRETANDISGNDFIYIAASKLAGRDYRNYLAAWGIETSQTAQAQVAALGITEQVPLLFYYVHNELPAVMPTLADTLPLDGVSGWADPTP